VNRVFRSTYHDTADRRLGRSGVALRRRLENGTSTWEVVLPEAPGRVALAAPGGPAGPPPLIADLLQAIVRQGELVEIEALQTEGSDERGEDDPGLAVIEVASVKSLPEKPSTRALIQARLQEQYSEILAHDPGTRLGDARGVAQATRRRPTPAGAASIRSADARPCLDGSAPG